MLGDCAERGLPAKDDSTVQVQRDLVAATENDLAAAA
jgi:hypothetical protein